jgi:simple sugar transport system ATP-binding protein
MPNAEAAVSMRDITKTFGPTVANDRVRLDIYRGEILALLGENGSGKTTLMNILSGIYYPDSGQVLVGGREVSIRSPKDAYALGIGMIHQHFKLVDVLTAAENIILGMKGKERLEMKAVGDRIRGICSQYGFEVDPDQKIYDMSVSQKQTVEIVKVLYRGADILILDEPTAVLTPQETDKLFAVLRNMRSDGKAVVIITHKLHEVEDLSDRVAVLRRGQFVGDLRTKDTNAAEMTTMMVGHSISLNIDRPEPEDPRPRLVVDGLTVKDMDGVFKLCDVSFTANSGEILGIAGISGCGQKELLESVAGLQPAESGSILYLDPNTGGRSSWSEGTRGKFPPWGWSCPSCPRTGLGWGWSAAWT